jgi:hypothetical protein
LKAGYNVINTIRIVETSENFIIYFNEIEIDSFEKLKKITGKNIGIYVGIGSVDEELFPQVPVDVEYMQK